MIYTDSDEFSEHLGSGERLIWTGKPKGGIIFRPIDVFLIPFSLLWCGFAIFWTIMATAGGGFFGLFGIPFVLVGLFIVFGRFIVDKLYRENVTYGITNNRIIIRSGIVSKTTRSIDLKTVTNLEYSEKGDGRGSITLGPKNPLDPFGMSAGMAWWPGVKAAPGLIDIPNVRDVYEILTRQRDE